MKEIKKQREINELFALADLLQERIFQLKKELRWNNRINLIVSSDLIVKIRFVLLKIVIGDLFCTILIFLILLFVFSFSKQEDSLLDEESSSLKKELEKEEALLERTVNVLRENISLSIEGMSESEKTIYEIKLSRYGVRYAKHIQ